MLQSQSWSYGPTTAELEKMSQKLQQIGRKGAANLSAIMMTLGQNC